MEEYGGPGGYQRGFSTEEFQTEGMHQQLGFCNNKMPKLYGAPLPPRVSRLDNSAQELLSKDWATVSRSEFPSADNRPPEWKPEMNMTRDETKAYINKWCHDNDIGRKIRFESEAQRAGNAAAKDELKMTRIRLLPGTPLAMEKMRDILIENHGLLAFVALRSKLPVDETTDEDLRAALNALGCPVQGGDRTVKRGLTKLEFSQIMSTLTKGLSFPTNAFFKAILGRDAAFDGSQVADTFRSVFREMATKEDILDVFNIKEYPEVHEGLSVYLDSYSTDGVLMESDFVLLHSDMYCANPRMYSENVSSLWLSGQ